MSLAKRVRDYRYAKGWGPDKLAERAKISRTALYQIESGKTELPRAATLRRIAEALEVPIDALLGTIEDPLLRRCVPATTKGNGNTDLGSSTTNFPRFDMSEIDGSVSYDFSGPLDGVAGGTNGHSRPYSDGRFSDLNEKLQQLLDSPFSGLVTRMIDEAHAMAIKHDGIGTASSKGVALAR